MVKLDNNNNTKALKLVEKLVEKGYSTTFGDASELLKGKILMYSYINSNVIIPMHKGGERHIDAGLIINISIDPTTLASAVKVEYNTNFENDERSRFGVEDKETRKNDVERDIQNSINEINKEEIESLNLVSAIKQDKNLQIKNELHDTLNGLQRELGNITLFYKDATIINGMINHLQDLTDAISSTQLDDPSDKLTLTIEGVTGQENELKAGENEVEAKTTYLLDQGFEITKNGLKGVFLQKKEGDFELNLILNKRNGGVKVGDDSYYQCNTRRFLFSNIMIGLIGLDHPELVNKKNLLFNMNESGFFYDYLLLVMAAKTNNDRVNAFKFA